MLPSKCEIFEDSIKYLGRVVDRHGIRPDPDAVEAVLTWISPKREHQLMSFLGTTTWNSSRAMRTSIPDGTINEAQRQEVHVEQRNRKIFPANKERVVRGTCTRDASRRKDVRARHRCVGSSDFRRPQSRTGMEREDSIETNSIGEQSLE